MSAPVAMQARFPYATGHTRKSERLLKSMTPVVVVVIVVKKCNHSLYSTMSFP